MSRKSGIRKILKYVKKSNPGQAPLLWNLRTTQNDLFKVGREFLENKKFIKARKNGVILYHEIISFNQLDKNKLTPEVLLDVAREYLERRAKAALAYALPHFNGKNPHVHLVISANPVRSRQKIRLSRREFQQVKQDLEKYQRERYPELRHSRIDHAGARSKIKKTRSEREKERKQRKARIHAPSLKEILSQTIQKRLSQASALAEFKDLLQKEGYTLYQRGKSWGIRNRETHRKHRFKTLGVQEFFQDRLRQWERSRTRAGEIQAIQIEKGARLWREQGFRDDILQAMKAPPGTRREQELRDLQRQKRAIQRHR